jgi:LPXTG-site transpeptidase (sortase) family protein
MGFYSHQHYMLFKNRYIKYCLYVLASFAVLTSSVSASQDAVVTDRLKVIETVRNQGVDQEFPIWAKPNLAQDNKDLSYRVNTVLPFTQDRNKDRYLVYPKYGIVVPVLVPSYTDQTFLNQWESFDYYAYFARGAFHYYGLSPQQGPSNMVIAAHSSFLAQEEGRYKTIFQVVPMSEVGDKIRYYEKNTEGTFDLYEYTITSSFETDKKNVSIMDYNHDGNSYLTTYSCYPLGTNTKRWVNKALLSVTTRKQSDLTAPAKEEILLPSANRLLAFQSHIPEKIQNTTSSDIPAVSSTSTAQPGRSTTKLKATTNTKADIVVAKNSPKELTPKKIDNQQKLMDQYVLDFLKKNIGTNAQKVAKLKDLYNKVGITSGKKVAKVTPYNTKLKRTITKYIRQYAILAAKAGK